MLQLFRYDGMECTYRNLSNFEHIIILIFVSNRFFVVRQVRKQLILRDNAVRRIASNEGSNRSNLTSNAESNRSNLTEPLMNDEEV